MTGLYAQQVPIHHYSVCLMFVVCFVHHVARTVYSFVRVYMSGDCELVNTVMISYKVWKPPANFNCCANPLICTMRSSGCGRRKCAAQRQRWT